MAGLRLDPAQFFPARTRRRQSGMAAFLNAMSPALSRLNGGTRGPSLGNSKATREFQKDKVSVGEPKPALARPGQTKPDASPTKTRKPIEQFGTSVRQRKPALDLTQFGNCGQQPDGSFG